MSGFVQSGRFAAGWSPSDVMTEAWYDSSNAGSFTYSSGSAVAQWNDLSGSARHLYQAAVGLQPSRTGTQNGLSTVIFDATDDVMQAATASDWTFLNNGTTCVIGMVWRTVSSNPGNLSVIVSTQPIDNSGVGFNLSHDDRAGASRNDRLLWYVLNALSGSSVAADAMSADAAFPSGSFGCTSVLSDPDAASAANRVFVYTNGGLVSPTNAAGYAPSAATPSYAFRVAGHGVFGTFTSIEVAEIVVMSGADATDPNRLNLEDYLATKWGL